MTFGEIPNGVAVFLDAHTLVYHFSSHPMFGAPCRVLLERIARGEVQGFTSSHVLSNLAHRLMTIEACETFHWPFANIAQRLNQHHSQIRTLSRFRAAVESVPTFGIQILPVTESDVMKTAEISQAADLLSNDALIVSIMQRRGLTRLASHDSDFDRVPGVNRFAPI